MKELKQALENIHAYINDAVLNREFEVLKREKHTTTIKCGEYVCDVWMANEPESTGIYELATQFGSLTLIGTGMKFDKPATCRSIINTPTSEEERKALIERKKQLEVELAKLKELGE